MFLYLTGVKIYQPSKFESLKNPPFYEHSGPEGYTINFS